MPEIFESRNETARMARKVAARLAYSEDSPQAQAKHLLLAMASYIDEKDIRVHLKKDGFLIIDGLGRSRFLTYKESWIYRIFGITPEKVMAEIAR
jgi:hypothetical protein